ncbi:MAG: hypothetical protein AABY22_17890, partial [Nanoarchaeota archaeon]
MTIKTIKTGSEFLADTRPKGRKYYCKCSYCETLFSFENNDLRTTRGYATNDERVWTISCPICTISLYPFDFYWIRYIIL